MKPFAPSPDAAFPAVVKAEFGAAIVAFALAFAVAAYGAIAKSDQAKLVAAIVLILGGALLLASMRTARARMVPVDGNPRRAQL